MTTPITYCTAQQYIAQFGLSEAAMLLRDEERELEAAWLDALVNDKPEILSRLSNNERTLTEAALARLNEGLRQSANLINGYLRHVVKLALTQEQVDSTNLKTCNAELTRCWLMDDADNATELAEKRCEQWRGWLRDVANKRVQLLPVDDAATSTGDRMTYHGQGASRLDWTGYP